MKMLIAVLEDNADRIEVMKSWLEDRYYMYEHYFSDTPSEFIQTLQVNTDRILIASLDHDLFERVGGENGFTGMMVVDYLKDVVPQFPVIIHSSNSHAAETMIDKLRSSHWQVARVIPFDDTSWIGDEWYPTLRRFIRRIAKPVMATNIGNEDAD